MRAFLVDDEPLALKRLRRLLNETGRVEIVGESSDPEKAPAELRVLCPDVLFLDIQMPGLSGFDLLARLGNPQPLVVFTTAYDQYALKAFEVNSVDYLLKPVEPAQLERAIAKLARLLAGSEERVDVPSLLSQMRAMIEAKQPEYLMRVASRVGDKVEFVDVEQVSHFYAKDKLTFAAASGKDHAIDLTITELEQKLDPRNWVRIHRSTLIHVEAVKELHSWFGGKLLVRLKDGRTELQVARERASDVKAKLGL
jgi:two-component system LytT family response regulator